MDMRTIDTVTVPKSFYWHGIWQAARWAVKVVDEEKGDVLLMAYLSEAVHDGQENVIAALRLGMDDVARLRALAGFGERPAPEGSRVPRYDVAHECNGVRLAELERRLDALEAAAAPAVANRAWMMEIERRLDDIAVKVRDATQRLVIIEERFFQAERRVTAGLPGADQMHEQYDAENDAATISHWDMRLLAMIETTNSRLAAAIGGG